MSNYPKWQYGVLYYQSGSRNYFFEGPNGLSKVECEEGNVFTPFIRQLNKLGGDGWELAHVEGESIDAMYHLKRIKT